MEQLKNKYLITMYVFIGMLIYLFNIILICYCAKSLNSKYIKYLFKSYPFIELLKTCVTGIREGQNINYDILRNKYLMLPPVEEQQRIVE